MIEGKRIRSWWVIEALLFLLLGVSFAKRVEIVDYWTCSSRDVQQMKDQEKFRELHRTKPLKVDSIDGVLEYENHLSYSYENGLSIPSVNVLLNDELMTDNVVANKIVALIIAEAAWFPIYLENHIKEGAPYIVDEDEKYYYINRDIQPSMVYDEKSQILYVKDLISQSPEIIIRKSDGKIVYICLGR